MGLDKSLNQSPQGRLKKKGYMSRNGPLGNWCKVLNKYLIGQMLGGQNGGSTIVMHVLNLIRTWDMERSRFFSSQPISSIAHV